MAGRGERIEALYAWVATEPDGGEGVCSMQIGEVHMPIVGADMERVESLRQDLEDLAWSRQIPQDAR